MDSLTAGYKALFKSGITELACLAHARRKFFDLYKANQSPIAQEALVRIGKLYAIDQAGRDLDILQRQALRQREARPVLDALFAWLRETLEKLPAWPNSRIDELLPLRREHKP